MIVKSISFYLFDCLWFNHLFIYLHEMLLYSKDNWKILFIFHLFYIQFDRHFRIVSRFYSFRFQISKINRIYLFIRSYFSLSLHSSWISWIINRFDIHSNQIHVNYSICQSFEKSLSRFRFEKKNIYVFNFIFRITNLHFLFFIFRFDFNDFALVHIVIKSKIIRIMNQK